MELFNPKNLNFRFVASFKYFVPLSVAFLFLCLFLMFVKPGLNYGLDFRGGFEATVAFKKADVTSAQLRTALDGKIEGLTIVESSSLSKDYAREFLITGGGHNKDDVSKALEEYLKSFGAKDQEWTIAKLGSVGPKVGSELRRSALMSLIYTTILITLYIYLRFDMRYSPGAMAGVLHDLIFTCGFLILTGTEFSTNVVAALLTLAGYSINDTVIVFDRIREIEHTALGKSKAAIVDLAINSTLSRTLMTSGVTLLNLVVLLFVGGPSLRDFSLTMLFGILVGTYSSVYIATPLYLWGDKFFNASQNPASTTSKPTSKMKTAKV